MYDLFNPAGLHVLEDRSGAVAFGWLAHRVFYARFVGSLSAELGARFALELEAEARTASPVVYFGDASALTEYDLVARTCFQRAVLARREDFASLTMLTWASGIGPASRRFAELLEPVQLVTDPVEFETLLANVAPLPLRARELEPVWQIHAPR